MAFPEDAIGLRAELLLGGDWTDITRDVFTRDPIRITHGTASEGATADPGACSLLLNNTDGKYSPRNATGPFYGLLGRNTPVRVTVPGDETYLALDGTTAGVASTPDTAALDIVGDIDIRVEVTTDWRATGVQTLIGKWVSASNQRSYILRLEAGLFTLNWSPDGTSLFFAQQLLPTLPRRAALRGTLDVNNGSGGMTATLYWAESLDGPWTVIGTPLVVSGVTSVYAGTASLEVAPTAATGWGPVLGSVHRAEVRSGIGGAVVAAPDFRALTPAATGFTDSVGRTWSLAGTAELTDREGLFAGEVAEWPPRWDAGGHSAWVPVEAAGILRRLSQGRRPLQSTLRRRIPSDPALLAYWPMEDGDLATQLYSPIDGVQPLRWSGLDIAADSSLAGSAPLPTLSDVASLAGTVPPAPVQGWQVELVYRLPTMPAVETEILRVVVAGSVLRTAHVYAGASGVRIEARNAEGDVVASFVFSDADALSDFAGAWNRLTVYTSETGGGQTRLACSWRDIKDGSWWKASTVYFGAMGSATAVRGEYGSATSGMSLGHLAVFAVAGNASGPGSNIFSGADRAFVGESALERLVRLSQEEPALRMVTVDGDTTVAAARMGPQGQVELMTLVGEVAETDGGILYERMDRLGLVYRDRATLYNQTPALILDYAAGHVAPPLEPTDDDATLRNDVTVTREGGSSGRAVVEEGPLSVLPSEQGGVGVYEDAVTLSLADDSQTQPIAGWRVHLGTWDEARYPSVRILLHRHPELIPAVLALRPGDLLRIANPPAFTGPGPLDLLVRQIDHQPLPRTWEVTFSCVPAGPYRVGVVDGTARADTTGSVLAMSAAATAAVLSVATPAGLPWITSHTVLTSNPAFEASLIGWTAGSGTTQARVATPSPSPTGGAWSARLTPNGAVTTTFTTADLVPTPAGTAILIQAWVRCAVARQVQLRIAWRDASAAIVLLETISVNVAAGEWTWINETRTAPVGTTQAGLLVAMAGTPPASNLLYVDLAQLAAPTAWASEFPFDLAVNGEQVTVTAITGAGTPQQVAVTRSVNSVVKAQPAGADVRLAHPTIAAL